MGVYKMKKRYYEFLNVLVTDCNPIRNLDFYKAGLIRVIFHLTGIYRFYFLTR